MGTRSLTFVYETYTHDEGNVEHDPIIKLYRQYDGYPEGHGLELANFLAPYHIVNGLGGDTKEKVANGMGCLAAQLVAHFKDGPGQFYLYPPHLDADNWQDYEYHVFKDKVLIKAPTDTIFEGTWEQFGNFCKEQEAVET